MLTVEEILSRAATPQAPPQAPPPLPPQPIYYAPAPQKTGMSWFAYLLIAVLIIGAFFVGSSGLVSVTDLSQSPAMATPAPGATILMPTAKIVLSNSSGVVTPVSAQPQAPPLQANIAVPTSVPAEPTALPVSDFEIPVPSTNNDAAAPADVAPANAAAAPAEQPKYYYQYDPKGPDPMPAKTTGEYAGWNGGAGAGWVIPTPKAQPVSSTRNRDETVAQTTGDYAGWGGGSGQGWEIPAADNNNGWSLGN